MPSGLSKRASSLRGRARRVGRAELIAAYRRLPIRKDTVFYESFSGNGQLCNPEAVFRGLLEDPSYAHLQHVWALSDLELYADTVREFSDHPRVRFVQTRSRAYELALATSGYLVNNATFQASLSKRVGQTYLNTWHGTPLKAMGYDLPDGGILGRNVVRNFLQADYLLAPNEATTDMYRRAYRLDNVFSGGLLHVGTPRVDKQFVDDEGRRRIRQRLVRLGVRMPPRSRIVVYAPTWRGDFYRPTNDIAALRARVEELSARPELAGSTILLKVHQGVYAYAAADLGLRDHLVPNQVPTNDLLALADVLVTDYSSVFVDFLATGRPVLFYTPDLDSYLDSRGLNVPPEELPGPVMGDLDALAAALGNLGTGGDDDPEILYRKAYARWQASYCPDEDGHATERLIGIVFGRVPPGDRVESGITDGRETILIYLGGMLPNGITTSALNLLDTIDHDRYDVSAFYTHTNQAERRALIASIHPRVRLFPRSGQLLASRFHAGRIRRSAPGPTPSRATDAVRFRRALREEWVRLFGSSRYDRIVDFSGYSPFWNKIMLQGGARSYSIWLHNDLQADAAREVDGRAPHRDNLEGIFELYRHTDRLVSVSPSLADVNRRKLSRHATPEHFTHARNTINIARVQRLAYGPRLQGGAEDLPPVDPADLGAAVQRLVEVHAADAVAEEARRRATVERFVSGEPGVTTFVTAGRLSPEKNHLRLVEAFATVYAANRDTRLVVLGRGPLSRQLNARVAELGLQDVVSLAGHLANPYAVLAASDCFVLSSDYEGQPMVFLEAMTLGLPIVTTAFDSVEDALPQDCGLVVERSVPALAEGMVAFLDGTVPTKPFDAEAYNRDAMEEFYRAIGAEDATC